MCSLVTLFFFQILPSAGAAGAAAAGAPSAGAAGAAAGAPVAKDPKALVLVE